MSEFTQALGSSLAAWDNHILPEPSDIEDMSYYDALAWSGDMLKSEAYNNLTQEEQDLIKLANENEGDANNASKQDAKGKNCPPEQTDEDVN